MVADERSYLENSLQARDDERGAALLPDDAPEGGERLERGASRISIGLES